MRQREYVHNDWHFLLSHNKNGGIHIFAHVLRENAQWHSIWLLHYGSCPKKKDLHNFHIIEKIEIKHSFICREKYNLEVKTNLKLFSNLCGIICELIKFKWRITKLLHWFLATASNKKDTQSNLRSFPIFKIKLDLKWVAYLFRVSSNRTYNPFGGY